MNMIKGEDVRDYVALLRRTVGASTLRLIVRVCKHRHVRGRYYLIENPAGSLAWVFEGLMAQILEVCEGKYIISDQCAYGKIDLESGRPIKKPTGWLSNAERLLNELGKRCKCEWGAHQSVLGSNRMGQRSRQAAAYPEDLCKAICVGTLKTMQLDYAMWTQQELSYPVEADEDDEMRGARDAEEMMIDEENIPEITPDLDTWEKRGNKLIRHHHFPRKALFNPLSIEDMPCDFRDLLPARVTYMEFEDGSEHVHRDDWMELTDPFKHGEKDLGR